MPVELIRVEFLAAALVGCVSHEAGSIADIPADRVSDLLDAKAVRLADEIPQPPQPAAEQATAKHRGKEKR